MIVPKSRLSELQDENRLLKHNIKELEEQVRKLQEILYEKDSKTETENENCNFNPV